MKKKPYILFPIILLSGIVPLVLIFSKPKESLKEIPQPTESIFKIPLDKNINNQGVIGLKEMAEDIQ